MTHDSFWRRWWRGFRRPWGREDWERAAGAGWAERIMRLPVTDHLTTKQGRSTGRLVLRRAGRSPLVVYLKRHYRLSWWRGLLAALWPEGAWAPAVQEARHLRWARRQGLPVPAVVAAGQVGLPGGRLQGFLAVEELTDMLPLDEAIPLASRRMGPAAFRRWKDGLVAEVARLARLLHDRRAFHKDLYLCHFYVPRRWLQATPMGVDGWRGQLFLIDLHRLGRHRLTWPLWQLKDLAQLLHSSEIEGVTLRDRVLFWRHYHAPGTHPVVEALTRWGVWTKWWFYRRHARRHGARAALDLS